MTSRRTFIQQAGLITAAVLAKPLVSCSALKAETGKIGIQLYTLREQLKGGVKDVISKVAQAGYKEVETYGYSRKDKFWGLEPKAFAELLKANGLTSPSGHYGFDEFLSTGKENDLQSYIEAAAILEQRYITVPYLSQQMRSVADDYKRIAEGLNKAAEICRRSNIGLAYHNHDFEFEKFDRTTGYQILLGETDPALVKFEADLYWIVRAGLDPVELFKQNKGRFVMWHVKDMDKTNPKINTEVGAGSIDFKQIFKEAKTAGVEYIFVEQENFSIDPYQSISKSYKYVKNDLLKLKS